MKYNFLFQENARGREGCGYAVSSLYTTFGHPHGQLSERQPRPVEQ